jgi:fatty-acyl-CoA synthase
MPEARTLDVLLHDVATVAPRRPAVHYRGETISYGELWREVAAAAHGLRAAGVRPGDRVAVLFPNCPEWLVATFGALTAGAVVVPLNTWYKERELEWTLRHCGVSTLLTVDRFLRSDYAEMLPRLLATLPELRTLVVAGADVAGSIRWPDLLATTGTRFSSSPDAAAGATRPRDRAFILYTSGSTAEPKGVVLLHGHLVESGYEIGARRLVTSDDVIWLGSPLFYGLGAANALPVALAHGASLVLDDTFDAGRAVAAMARHGATVYYGTGNMTQAILEHPSFDARKLASVTKGTAGLSAEYKRLAIVGLGLSLATPGYGLTESYGHALVGRPDDPLEIKLHTDGEPLPGVELRIVDPETDLPVPRGQTGRVLLRGRIAPAYHADPGEASAAFRVDGLFDTQDVGRLDDGGRFVFMGRLKDVIKSGGVNVSPIEVEQVLAEHPQVRDAHVVGVTDPALGELIVAFVDTRVPVGEDEIREFVRERAASFKVPTRVLVRAESQIPRLASGKVARQLLVEQARLELGI